MKTKLILVLVVILVTVGFLTSCDLINDFIESRTRAIPLLQVYNSNFEKTLRMLPNDTLYVEARGLKEGVSYTIQALDYEDKVITQIVVQANEDGVINPTALWYDIGFRVNAEGQLYLPQEAIDLKAFHIRVFDGEDGDETDFQLPFFIINSTAGVTRAKPIVMAGKQIDGTFFMENAFYSEGNAPTEADVMHDFVDAGNEGEIQYPGYTDQLFVNVANMSSISGNDQDLARIWILPFPGDIFEDGKEIAQHAWFFHDFSVEELKQANDDNSGVLIEWPIIDDDEKKSPQQTINMEDLPNGVTSSEFIPEWAEGKAYSVFLDMMDNGMAGIYNIKKNIFAEDEEASDSFFLDSIDGNGVAGFIVRNKPSPPKADYLSLNLASGGIFRYVYEAGRYRYDYDYRDNFIYHGLDTKFAPYYRVPYGIKIIWNPYGVYSYWGMQPTGTQVAGLYYGRNVDVYVVTTEQPLTPNAKIGGENGEHLAVGTVKQTLAVQYGCGNGLGMQNIWNAPMLPGNYYVIVDMDRGGVINDNCIIDDVRHDEDATKGGFSVVNSY